MKDHDCSSFVVTGRPCPVCLQRKEVARRMRENLQGDGITAYVGPIAGVQMRLASIPWEKLPEPVAGELRRCSLFLREATEALVRATTEGWNP